MNREYMIGCNYWASSQGIYMWRNWEEDIVRQDLEKLASYGLDTIRVFPLWSDFQPIEYQRSSTGNFIKIHDKYPTNDLLGKACLDKTMMERFNALLDIAKENNIAVVVGLITGWMSGKHFVPSAFQTVNPITDHFAVMWEQKFIRAFVTYFKDHSAIKAWNLGNECNAMSMGKISREDAVVWTGMVVDAIRSVDSKRPIYSGMHSLQIEKTWNISDQGELCDMLTVHPYPMFTPLCDIDPMNSIRGILHAAAEARYYAGVGEKPCLIEEINTLGPMTASEENASHYIRRVLLSGFAYDATGLLWWCGFEQDKLDFSPYCDCALERELGLLHTDENNTPKPMMLELEGFAKEIMKLDLLEFSPSKTDAVCILTPEQDHWASAYAVFTLCVQAGINVKFCYSTQDIPEAPLYFMPCITGLNGMEKSKYNDILKRVENGAKLYISHSGGFLSEFEKITGLRPVSRRSVAREVRFEIENESVFVNSTVLTEFQSVGAQILIENDDEIILTKNKFKNGEIYFLSLPLEENLSRISGGFEKPFYKLYKYISGDNEYIVKKESDIGVTVHTKGNDTFLFVVNYTYDDKSDIILNDNVNYQEVYGKYDGKTMTFENGLCIVKVEK